MTSLRKGIAAVSLLMVATSCTKSREFGPPKENTYRMPLLGKIVSLDPHVTSDVYSTHAQALAYESLFQYDYLKEPRTLIPALAAEMPKPQNGFKKFVFKIKPGIRFQDDPCFKETGGKGREMTADDWVYFFKRVADKKTGSPIFSGFHEVIAGIDDYREGKTPEIAGVKVLDKYTFQVELLKSQPRFLYGFANSHGATMPKECVEFYGERIGERAIGTGPFRITSFSRVRVTAERNPNFRDEFYPSTGTQAQRAAGLLEYAGKKLPLVDKVELEVHEEDQPRWLKFMAGEFEYTTVPKDNIGAALPGGKLSPELEARKVKFITEPQSDVVVEVFNLLDPVWGKNKELRHAYALAFDKKRVMDVLYAGYAIFAHSLVDPSMYGYDPKFKSQWNEYNLAKAKELLAKAGFPGGKGLPPIVAPTFPGATYRQMGELVQRMMAEAGIEYKFEQMPWPEFSKRIKEGNFTLARFGWTGDVPDAESILPIFHSRAFPPNGQNYARFKNERFDKLIEEIEVLENGSKRFAKINEAKKILDEEMPVYSIVHRTSRQLYQPWVKNVTYVDEVLMVPFMKYRALELKK